jgi:hypothetical protein
VKCDFAVKLVEQAKQRELTLRQIVGHYQVAKDAVEIALG